MAANAPGEAIQVIIPTMAKPERADCLWRAIDSVVGQRGVDARPLVIVNGPGADPALIARLASRSDLDLLRLERADLPAAILTGVRRVSTRWFAELDDDDRLMPDTLAARRELGERVDSDVVVANGISHGMAGDTPLIPDMAQVIADPLLSLTKLNWLSPGAALFRTGRVPASLFVDMPAYLEWTWLAVRLAQECRIAFLNEPGLVYRNDSPDALSRSVAAQLGAPAALMRILALDLPMPLRRFFQERLTSACNAAARIEAARGQRGAAWRWHLRCLLAPGGWRYLPFTRRLLWNAPVVEPAN